MKVTLVMSQSLNGIIADQRGREDFLSDDDWQVFARYAERAGGFIIGRRTYKVVSRYLDTYGTVSARGIVVSQQSSARLREGFQYASSPNQSIQLASQLGLKEVVLSGGSQLNRAFILERLINELVVNIDPVIVGSGVPLIAPFEGIYTLAYVGIEHLSGGTVQLRYLVQ